MDISHLYHDSAFNDPTIELDVKEQMQTRIANAREERHLETLSRSYEKAKFICEKNIAWERWRVGQSLHGICERSPHLDRSLAKEKARMEQLQRSILIRNLRMRNKRNPHWVKPMSPMKPTSPMLRSVSSTTTSMDLLSPREAIARRKRRQRRKEQQKAKEEQDGKTHSITEKHLQKQGDFTRRSEHVVKSLAKLNWRQQNRRRDHEKFKEELILHSKPVIEKAKVILKGRSDIDLDNMMMDFENILLPHPHYASAADNNGSNLNSMNNFKHSKSSLSSNVSAFSKANVLTLPTDLPPPIPTSSQTESPQTHDPISEVTTEDSKTKIMYIEANGINSASNSNMHDSNSTNHGDIDTSESTNFITNPNDSTSYDNKLSADDVENNNSKESSTKDENSNATNKVSISNDTDNIDDTDTSKNKNKYNELSHHSVLPAISQNVKHCATEDITSPRSTTSSNSSKNSNSSSLASSYSSQTRRPTIIRNGAPSTNANYGRGYLGDVFSPSTSVSQVIIEEDEENEEKINDITKNANCVKNNGINTYNLYNNNNISSTNINFNNRHQPLSSTQFFDKNNNDLIDSAIEASRFQPRSPQSPSQQGRDINGYRLACTLGLPQMWKIPVKKKKEKVMPEVSAATIARKHRKIRNESERMW